MSLDVSESKLSGGEISRAWSNCISMYFHLLRKKKTFLNLLVPSQIDTNQQEWKERFSSWSKKLSSSEESKRLSTCGAYKYSRNAFFSCYEVVNTNKLIIFTVAYDQSPKMPILFWHAVYMYIPMSQRPTVFEIIIGMIFATFPRLWMIETC